MKIAINKDVYKYIFNHARQTYPYECYGFLFGNVTKNRLIFKAQRLENAKEGNQRNRYGIRPNEYQNAEKFAKTNQLKLLGIYHSHPNHPATPSDNDIIFSYPYFSYLIISLDKNGILDIRSWRLNNESFVEEVIVVKKLSQVP